MNDNKKRMSEETEYKLRNLFSQLLLPKKHIINYHFHQEDNKLEEIIKIILLLLLTSNILLVLAVFLYIYQQVL